MTTSTSGDAVAAFLAAADRGRPGTWNIGSGREVSVLELARVIGQVAGRPVEPVFNPPRPGELQRSALAIEAGRAGPGLAARHLAERRGGRGVPLDRGRRAGPGQLLTPDARGHGPR